MAIGQMPLKVQMPSANFKGKSLFLYPYDFRNVQSKIHPVHSGSKVSLKPPCRQILS